MRVLRVENEDGEGPYRAFKNSFGIGMYDEDIQPGPCRDGIYSDRFNHNMLFGFKDEEQLLHWFNPHNDTCWVQYEFMARHGFMIVEYDVEKVVYGHSQVVFHPTQNKKVILTMAEFVH